jgi:HEAT repeat protein
VRHLATAIPERAGPLLERLLSASSPAVLRAAAEGIGDLSYRPAVPRLVGLLSRADSETAATVAAALGGMGDPSVEPALLALLEREDEPLRVAAARALGRVGTVAAVEPLLACTGGFLDSNLKRTAREAVGSIQSRLGDVGAGRLSVADISPSEGALSLSTGEAGGLSVGGNDEEDRA